MFLVIYTVKNIWAAVKWIWYLSPMRAAKVQASLRIRAVSPKPPLLAHTSSESRGTLRQKARSLAPLNGWACAVKICHGMLEDTNSLDAPQLPLLYISLISTLYDPRHDKTNKMSPISWMPSLISLRCPGPLLPIERTAKTLIRLGRCPGWSESSLGAHSFCWFCHVVAHILTYSFITSSCSFSITLGN